MVGAHLRETIGAVEYVVGDRLFGVGHVAEQHVAYDAKPLEHVHAATNIHVAGGVHADSHRPQLQEQQDRRDGTGQHRGHRDRWIRNDGVRPAFSCYMCRPSRPVGGSHVKNEQQ